MSKTNNKTKRDHAITRRNRLHAYLFLAPNFIGFVIFTLVPVVMALAYSFTNYDGNTKMSFVGLSNYVKLFNDSSFIIALRNTLIYTIGTVPFVIILALLVSVLMNSGVKGSAVYRAIMLFPHIASIIAVVVVWRFLYAEKGPINAMLTALGFTDLPIWLSNKNTALGAVMIMIIWKGIGYYMITYLAGLKGIPTSLYEAATMDGANARQKLIYVTIPQLRPVTFYATIMCIINSFQVFTPVYVMTGGGPGRATSVLVLKIYEDAFTNFKFGYASAEAMVLFLMILIVTLYQYYHNKKLEA
ncbi:MAG: sugar ABC transporter permease [Lachnospiraceae bacterium]|nr:sugar ABC transporter permease [Lachnospiraceae bacterium]